MITAKERPNSFYEELSGRFDNWWYKEGSLLTDLTDAEIVTEFILNSAAAIKAVNTDANIPEYNSKEVSK